MKKVHENPILETEQLALEDITLCENVCKAKFILTGPYLITKEGIRPSMEHSCLLRPIFYEPKELTEYIQGIITNILMYAIPKGKKFSQLLEVTKIIPRLFEEDQTTLDGKFKINAFQAEGILNYRHKTE